ncbi:hypothetical protein F511_21232 [Dorcoceras hygrometricum]|uniref:Uncharacterized protein n=1 Tax=Dorcoceras hygrometricum TaxID=472368 RepID=A0A2Z7BK49_9LAMI|nr:hypothetical protein F511_21232 [Dorcoceras hygrometricum]
MSDRRIEKEVDKALNPGPSKVQMEALFGDVTRMVRVELEILHDRMSRLEVSSSGLAGMWIRRACWLCSVEKCVCYWCNCCVAYVFDAIIAIRRDPLALPSGPITRGRSKRFKEALHGLVLSTQEMFKEEPAHEKLVGGLRDYIINIIQVQD